MSGQYKLAWLCEALLVSRSGYYDWVQRRRQPGLRQLETARLRERIRHGFARSRQTYGSPRLAYALGCPGRRNRIARLMRAERLFARQRSKYRVRTTDSQHGGPIAPNRLQGLTVRHPDQVWVTDATGILTGQGWLYLVAVLDLCSRRVVGWATQAVRGQSFFLAFGGREAEKSEWQGRCGSNLRGHFTTSCVVATAGKISSRMIVIARVFWKLWLKSVSGPVGESMLTC